MLSQGAAALHPANKLNEDERLQLHEIAPKLGPLQYQDLIQWVQEYTPSILSIFASITQIINAQGLSGNTSYHSRVYFDVVLNFYCRLPVSSPKLMAVVCISLAINLHELKSVSEGYPPHYLLRIAQLEVSQDQVNRAFADAMIALDFNFSYIVPEAYFQKFSRIFSPSKQAQLKEAVINMISLAIILPETCSYSAEQIFYSSVLVLISYKELKLNKQQARALESLTNCWAKATSLGAIVYKAMVNIDKQDNNQ